jgi:hypothetical protein
VSALGAARSDLDAVEAIVRAAGTSFHRGMAILPADRRHAMYAIYAFCRIVDDIVDEPGALAAKRAELDRWRARIAALYAGVADDLPVSRILLRAIRAYGLRQEDFVAVIDGMQMDGETDITEYFSMTEQNAQLFESKFQDLSANFSMRKLWNEVGFDTTITLSETDFESIPDPDDIRGILIDK